MQRPLASAAVGAMSVALVTLATPAPAGADLLSDLTDLSQRRLSPAPLVPTTAPPILSPLEKTYSASTNRRRGGYGIRLVHYTPSGPDAVIAIAGGDFTSMRAALRDSKRFGFTGRGTRVRGHRGYLLKRLRGQEIMLLWRENRTIYSIATGTTRKVSLRQLRATAAGLDPLERDYVGSIYDDERGGQGGVLVTTKRTITGLIEFGGKCVAAGGSVGPMRAGSLNLSLAPRAGNSFSFPLTPSGWTGQVSGTISPSAITLNLQGTQSAGAYNCDTGPVTVLLDKRSL